MHWRAGYGCRLRRPQNQSQGVRSVTAADASSSMLTGNVRTLQTYSAIAAWGQSWRVWSDGPRRSGTARERGTPMARSKTKPTRQARPETTPGPQDCLRSTHVSANCGKCGARADVTHMPIRARGFFCETCCPCCTPPGRDATSGG